MKRTAIMKNTPKSSRPERTSKKVLAVSQLVEFEGSTYLNLDLYYMGTLTARYFADKERKQHAAHVNGQWRGCMINNVARLCEGLEAINGEYYYCSTDWEFSAREDKEEALGYLETCSVEAFERSAGQLKYERAYQRKCERIEKIMNAIPVVPEQMENWAEQKLFPGHLLFIRKGRNRTEYSCTACGAHSWKKKGWKHGQITICPKCGHEVKAYSRRQEKEAGAPVVLLQACGQEWVERQFHAVCTWKAGGKKEIKFCEDIRALIPKGDNYGKLYYGVHNGADEFEQEWWDRKSSGRRFAGAYLYPGNLEEALPYGNLENSGIKGAAESLEKINVNTFIATFRYRPYLEYFLKAGLYRLAADILETCGYWDWHPEEICTYAKSLKGALQLDGNRTNRMKQINGGLNALRWLQYEEESGVIGNRLRISGESLEYLNRKNISPDSCREILAELGSVNRMVNYIKKQKIAPGKIVQTWRDYLDMARDEGLDTEDDIVRLPKDLKARHDHLVEIRNARRDAEEMKKNKEKYRKLDKKIQEHLPEARRYFWENEGYMIIPAGKCEELMAEGRTLHHCVGRSDIYMNKMADGKSWILFLRKKEELEKPYYTIEIDMNNDNILQWYSEFDRKPDEKVIGRLLNAYKNSIRRKRVKIA